MYWPHGVPRVYAVNGPDIPYVSSYEDREIDATSTHDSTNPLDYDENDEAQQGIPGTQRNEPGTEPSPDAGTSKWEDETIKGVCVARAGQIFATMTDTSIALWQTRVCSQPWCLWRGSWALILIIVTAHSSCCSSH
jgi:hypothetical protein